MKKFYPTNPAINTTDTLRFIKICLNKNFPNENVLTKKLENILKKLLKVRYVILTTSGTSAIYLALKANNIGRGDEVIIPNITFPATANAVHMTGAKVVLADVCQENLLLDVDLIKTKFSKKTKAIIPVHISGRGNNIVNLKKFADKKKVTIIEDAAEALGSKYKNKSLGTFGACGCFSLAPNKIITTGQGGIVVTNDKKLYKKIILLRDQGRYRDKKNVSRYLYKGFNFKFTDLQSGLGLSQIKNFKKRKEKLLNIFKFYKKNLIQSKSFKIIGFDTKNGELPLWTDVYCTRAKSLYNYLKSKGIFCRFFWEPINTLKPYKKSFKSLQTSKKLKNNLMWLPSGQDLKKNELKFICSSINQFFK